MKNIASCQTTKLNRNETVGNQFDLGEFQNVHWHWKRLASRFMHTRNHELKKVQQFSPAVDVQMYMFFNDILLVQSWHQARWKVFTGHMAIARGSTKIGCITRFFKFKTCTVRVKNPTSLGCYVFCWFLLWPLATKPHSMHFSLTGIQLRPNVQIVDLAWNRFVRRDIWNLHQHRPQIPKIFLGGHLGETRPVRTQVS